MLLVFPGMGGVPNERKLVNFHSAGRRCVEGSDCLALLARLITACPPERERVLDMRAQGVHQKFDKGATMVVASKLNETADY